MLTEQSTHIRTKALKCMTNIVTEDPEVLFRKDMQARIKEGWELAQPESDSLNRVRKV